MHNVLYVSHTARLGGAEHSLLLLLEHLDRDRFRPMVAVPARGPLTRRLDELGVGHCVVGMSRIERSHNPVTLARYFLMWRRAIGRIAELIRDLDIDLVHANSTTAHLFAAPAAKRRHVPCVWHVRDASSPGGWLDRMMVRNARAIVAISESVRSGLHHPRMAADKTSVIPNGVDTERFAPAERMTVRNELGLSVATPAAGILGQVVPWKRHDLFLEAAAAVSRRLPEARFLVVGDNRFGDWPGLIDGLRQQSQRLGIADRVLFLGWRDDVVAILNAMDVLVMTSENEPFGRVVIEAMACGKPVVSFRCGGPAEIIEHEKTGLLVAPRDVSGLAGAMERLLADPARCAEMGKLAREHVCRKFSAELCAGRVQEVYARLLR